MQRIPATMEEQLVLKTIKEECPWENLPKRLQATLNSREDSRRRSYALTPVYEPATRPVEESPSVTTAKVEKDDAENKEEIYPGVNLLFDGSELRPFEIGACLQARQPVSLIAEVSATSAIFSVK